MRRDALVVGINLYPCLKDTSNSKAKHLTTPAVDAEKIAQLLEADQDFRVIRLPESRINGKFQVDPNKSVSADELLEAITKLFLPSEDLDTALLFFAGHGLQKPLGTLKQTLLATSDANPQLKKWNGILLRDLWEIIKQSYVKEQIIWIDCCYGGELLNFKENEFPNAHNRFLIAASHSSEVAYERFDGKHGVLSGALIEGLDSEKIDHHSWITARTLGAFVDTQLKKYYAETKIPQQPQIRIPDQEIRLVKGRGQPSVNQRSDTNKSQFDLSASTETKPALSHCSSDLEKLQQEADYVLNDIRSDIGGFKLDRTDLIANAQKKILEASVIEIVGSSGVGKSAVLKTLVEYQQKEGQVVVLSGDRIAGTGWSSYAGALQLKQPLNKLILALSINTQPIIFIDGIDRITETGKQTVIKDLFYTLAEIPLSEDGSRHWKVVFSTREENLREVYKWLNWQALGEPVRLEVPELTQAELQSVVEHIPRLKPLLSLSQLSPILKNPLMLKLLEDPRMLPNLEDLPPIATEIEVSNVWWSRVVIGQNPIIGEGREQILTSLGEKAVKSPGTRLRIENANPEAVVSLKQDRILIQDIDRRLFRFGHDLLEDWVMLRVINEYREELPAYLKELGEPFGLLRAVQLVGVALLESHVTAEFWINLIEQVEQASELSPRWRQALLTAPLVSPRCSELLNKAEPILIADNARRLIELLVALRTLEVMPNFSLMYLFTKAELESSDRVMPILMSDPIPRWSVWEPFMGWLLKRINDLPSSIRPEVVKLMEIWQVKSPTGSIYRKEIGEIAIAWLKEQEASRGW
ncbi:hypothetical protein FJR11_22735 [Anabaena sp. UHCC 0187]|uniref:caspase family protein n=1 Tax=Anabaena sp. UHCC 0187 TaxID=2590018 RepID=UPI001446888B|nr:caspase family protein [Anabaena sp. UHCC 0187]MTJ15329.1 hypothetical protein [Anabaena sp. UHCC 0187]